MFIDGVHHLDSVPLQSLLNYVGIGLEFYILLHRLDCVVGLDSGRPHHLDLLAVRFELLLGALYFPCAFIFRAVAQR